MEEQASSKKLLKRGFIVAFVFILGITATWLFLQGHPNGDLNWKVKSRQRSMNWAHEVFKVEITAEISDPRVTSIMSAFRYYQSIGFLGARLSHDAHYLHTEHSGWLFRRTDKVKVYHPLSEGYPNRDIVYIDYTIELDF